jgi:hypothetical protein
MNRSLGKLAILGLCVSLFFLSCTEDSKPTKFSMGEPIPLGDATMTISSIEETQRFSPFLQKSSGYSQLVVFLSCEGFELERGNLKSMKNALSLFSLTLALEDGKKFRLATLVPESAYRMAQAQLSGDYDSALSALERSNGRTTKDWAAIFQVPERSHGYTLLIKNPRMQKGQAAVAAVPLGR